MFDVLIVGGGAAGMSCALVLGSAHAKPYAAERKIGVFVHQKASALQDGLYNNAYGIAPGTLGADLLVNSRSHLASQYPHVVQIENEKVTAVNGHYPDFEVVTNKGSYRTREVVIAVGSSSAFFIEGVTAFVMPHQKAAPEKNRIQLQNTDHLVAPGLYVAGTLAGWRSQLAIAAGSGAAVATDILTNWNDGKPSQVHDSTRPH